MLIKNYNQIQDKKSLLLLIIIDILKTYSSPEHSLTKEQIRDKIEEICGFRPARNTLYEKLRTLKDAGISFESEGQKVFYTGHELCDGELRFLTDSILYSDFVTHQGAFKMVTALEELASPSLQKYIHCQKTSLKSSRKSSHMSVFLNIEDIQTALNKNKQISMNYLTYQPDLSTEQVYPDDITVNPYGMVFKNGKYYLLGSVSGSNQIQSWRVDHICNVKQLEKACVEIPMMKEIRASGGIAAYAESQPDISGGVVETFKIQCAKDSIDEIVDVFGTDFSIAPEQDKNFDDETVILKMRTTRESMKAWAFAHAGSMVVIAPEDFREEITESLSDARRQYSMTGKPAVFRMFSAKNLAESVRFAKQTISKNVRYHGKEKRLGRGVFEKESVDLSILLDFPAIRSLTLTCCKLEHFDILKQLPFLTRIHLFDCELSDEQSLVLEQVTELHIDRVTDALRICDNTKLKKLDILRFDMPDVSFISEFPALSNLTLFRCDRLTNCAAFEGNNHIERLEIIEAPRLKDYSFLEKMPSLKFFRLSTRGLTEQEFQVAREKLEARGVRVRVSFRRDDDRLAEP